MLSVNTTLISRPLDLDLSRCIAAAAAVVQGPTGQGKLENVREFEWSGKIFFLGKVTENEKLLPPDVRFSGYNARNSISAGAPPQTPLGELTVLPRLPSCT